MSNYWQSEIALYTGIIRLKEALMRFSGNSAPAEAFYKSMRNCAYT